MKEYLSIGEVARLKKITVKALRYYEKIGILLPVYINEESGYRYYSMEQMVVLDFILTSLELGIPLKRFPSYLDGNGGLDIDRMLQDGTHMAQQEITRINRTAEKLKNMSRHLEESELLSARGVACLISARFLLTEPMQTLFPTQRQYVAAMTELYCRMEAGQYTNLYRQGLLYQNRNGITRCYAYNEVERPADLEQVTVLPAGEFVCQRIDRARETVWLQWLKPFLQSESDESTLLIQERYERHLSKEPFWGLQIMRETPEK